MWVRREGRKGAYELGKEKVVEYQPLSRPRIEEVLGTEDFDRCCGAMLREYDAFAPRLPALEDRNNRGVFYRNAPFTLSLYRALLGESGMGREEALEAPSGIARQKVRQQYGGDPVEQVWARGRGPPQVPGGTGWVSAL